MVVQVVGAVIVRDGLVLCARRGASRLNAGLWEFPGGKVEVGESSADALQREIAEELGCDVHVGQLITETAHATETGSIVLTTYYCELIAGIPALTEHAELRWMFPDELNSLAWAPADVPAVELVARAIGRSRP